MPRLRFVSTVQGADTIELQEPIITIGRDPLNVVCIEDPNISKHHVLLIRDANTYKIYDLHSVNTTTVNGSRITTSTLKEGDIIRIGYLDFTLFIAAFHHFGLFCGCGLMVVLIGAPRRLTGITHPLGAASERIWAH